MPIYKAKGKKDGLQKYRVVVNYTDMNGEYQKAERVAYGKDDARDTESRLQAECKQQTKKITLKELAAEFYNIKQYEVRESSLDKMKRRLEYYVTPILGDKRVDKLTVPVLQAWKKAVEEMRTSKDKPLSVRTKQSAFSELSAVLNYGVDMGYIQSHNMKKVKNFKDPNSSKKKKMDFYTAKEFLDYIHVAEFAAARAESEKGTIQEWNYYVFFMIAFYTGMRKGEIHALTWNDIEGDTIHVTKSITQKLKGGDRITPPKNAQSERDIKLPSKLQNCLKTHLNRLKRVDGFETDNYVCNSIRDTTISNRNKTYAEAAGLKTIRIHDFRHSHASYLAHRDVNIQEIARRLGHAKIEITWNTYSHLYPSDTDKAVEVLNDMEKPKNYSKKYKIRGFFVDSKKETA